MIFLKSSLDLHPTENLRRRKVIRYVPASTLPSSMGGLVSIHARHHLQRFAQVGKRSVIERSLGLPMVSVVQLASTILIHK